MDEELSMVIGMRLAISSGLVAALFFAGVSSAQVKASNSDGGYGYQFDDDPLNAGGFTSSEAMIRVRPPKARVTLIRPRTSFVPSMLQSVENL
jgi:hypothetical protein